MNTNQPLAEKRSGRPFILRALLALDVFVLGGLVALVIVSRLLNHQMHVYEAYHMASASVILDLMDDLFPYHLFYVLSLPVLTLLTVIVWMWRARPRYGVVALALTLVAISVLVFLGRSERGSPIPPPRTPTPLPHSVEM